MLSLRNADLYGRLKETQSKLAQVEDSGPGIPSDTLSKVFDPFFTIYLPA